MNTHVARKLPLFEFITLMALLTSLVALSIDAMLPALEIIGDELNAKSAQQTFLVVTVFFVGMSVGQLIFGPFSDAKGRRLTILVGLIIFLFGTLICYMATSMESLLFGRVIQAIGVSGPRIASTAMIRDLYVGDEMARVMSFINVIFIAVPMLAPLVGQAVMHLYGWRQIFFVFALVALITCIWFFSRQDETLPKQYRIKFNVNQYVRTILWLLKHPVVMGASIGMGSIFGGFLGYLSSSQAIFVQIYDTGDFFPLIFAILAFAIGVASLFNGVMVMRFGMHKIVTVSLWGTLLYAIALVLVTLWFNGLPPLILFSAILFVGFFFIGGLFGNVNALAMEPLGHIAGVGASFVGSFTSLLSVPIGIIIAEFVYDDVTPVALGFLIFSALAFASIKFALRCRMQTHLELSTAQP
ncbi:MAG: multidrug effflux MFS transporter [Pseudomonadota bacterium]